MKNYVCSGERIDVTVPAGGLTSGQVYLLGTKVVVMVTGGVEGDVCEAATEGVFTIPKATGAVSKGQALYWDDTAKNLTTTVGSNTYAGYAFAAALSADATVQVVLVDNPAALDAGQATVITALGTTTNLTAIAGTFANLAAAQTAVSTLHDEVEARLDAIEAKVDALIAALKAANLMATS